MDKLVLGDGFQEGVTQGPLINQSQFNKVFIKQLVLGDGFQEGDKQGPLINQSQFNKVFM